MKAISKITLFKIKVFTRVPPKHQQCNVAYEINKDFKSEPEIAKLCFSDGEDNLT